MRKQLVRTVCARQVSTSKRTMFQEIHPLPLNNIPVSSHQQQRISQASRDLNYADKVMTERNLTIKSIKRLLNGEICAIVVPGFTSNSVADKLSRFFSTDIHRTQYNHEYTDPVTGERKMEYFGVDRIGVPFNSVYGTSDDSHERSHYYSQARKYMELIRSASDPYLTPVDKLRLELDEIWPEGAKVASFDGRKMFCGIGRVMSARYSKMSAEQPHFDYLPKEEYPLDFQLAANIYLSVPEKDGELEVFDHPECTPEDEIPKDWRPHLPPAIAIRPNIGDLVIMNPRRPHAIREFGGNVDRVSMQCFLGFEKGKPIVLWN